VASQPVNNGGQTPGAHGARGPQPWVKFLSVGTLHTIHCSAIKWPQKDSCSVEKVNFWSLLGPGA